MLDSAAWRARHDVTVRCGADDITERGKDAIIARRGKNVRNIAKVAAARKMLEVVYYVLRDGQARCLTTAAPAA
jgi:hypothetical protein